MIFTGVVITACEKDDICPPDSGTTAYLKVGFFDIQDREVPKAVPRLRIVGVGKDITVGTFADRSSQTEVALPLKNYDTASEFFLVQDSASDSTGAEIGNIDRLAVNYQTNERFISRGCGYAVTYTLNQVTQNPGGSDPSPWILALEVTESGVEPQDTLHVKIYH
ncbi:hypothetical protein E7Z59_11980 [Robertkochia marina]|uniref:Uncharacterized protein n=2 Tax=Robertkochia marina TaxID=1227945 RepID=A0A4S3M1I1_9FLAO|nr:hypothetical protein E7Z59_11980 [Robertkochia marina]TRZ45647.1 hypothetical protein D3A96_06655 [Robertkochia marina]